jgi:hypothetical protein
MISVSATEVGSDETQQCTSEAVKQICVMRRGYRSVC